MGRYVRFYYDAAKSLIPITVSGHQNGADRQVMRFYYQNVTINQAKLFETACNPRRYSAYAFSASRRCARLCRLKARTIARGSISGIQLSDYYWLKGRLEAFALNEDLG